MKDKDKRKTRGKRTASGKGKAKAAALPKTRATPRTKQQLIEEMASLRQRLAELETVEADSQRIIGGFWEKEETLAKFMNASPDAFLLFDSNMDYITFNKAAQQLTGVTLEQAAGKNVTDFVPGIKESGRYAQYMNVIKTGQPFWADDLMPHSIFGGKHFTVRAFKVGDGLGLIFTDITERQKAEAALRESENRYRSMVENISDVIYTTDSQGMITYISPAIEQIAGYKPEEAVGKPFLRQFIHPDDLPEVLENFQNTLSGNPPQPREYRGVARDGNIFYLRTSSRPIMKDGKPAGVSGTLTNITERKQAEEALKKSEAQYKTLTESSLTGIYIIQDDKYVYVNDRFAKMHGYTPGEVVGMEYWKLVHPDERETARERMARRLRGESAPAQFIGERITSDGRNLWVDVITSVIEYKSKPAIIGNLVDITERKKLEQEREAMQQRAQVASRLAAVGEMAAGIAHEINNPLTGVIGYAELLASREDLPEDVRKDLATIDQGARRVADIVKRLLIFARQTKPSRDYVSIKELIENTLELRAYQLKTGNIAVTTEFAPDLPATVADGGQLQQVFLNIIVNAETEMKLAHGRGKLLIKTRKVDNHMLISFTDDGPGINKENLEKIFDPFFTTREVGKGTGLGLSICYGIIAEHNGRIWAESQLGKGATFLIELPIVTEMEKTEDTEPVAEPRTVTSARILVVDDEEVIREFLSRVLTGEGHQVETADNAAEALEKMQSGRYRLILLDIKMPGMSGVELYWRLKGIAKSLTDRVVFVTGDVMGADTEKFLEETGAPYITKPFDSTRLKQEMRKLLG